MAFSTTVAGTRYLGPGASTLWGSWSGAAGDAAGTLAIGGVVLSAIFSKFDSDNGTQILPRVTSSVTGNITTLTINNQDNVTNGYFIIEKTGQ